MSFKRDGDDKCLIQNLNNQRVKELLSNHIPQDEAKLLSNGRPIFDTINMLSIHRKGKRHLLELSKHIQCKEDMEKRLLQKKELLYFSGDQNSLPKSSMLGSRHMTSKQNALQSKRKPILEFKPLMKKKKLEHSSSSNSSGSTDSVSVKQYLKQMSRKSSLEKVVERNRENYGIDLRKEIVDKKDQITTDHLLEPGKDSKRKNTVPYHIETQEYEMKLRMSGWIKDAAGQWIKDPNAEFDSDDDEVPPPLPT